MDSIESSTERSGIDPKGIYLGTSGWSYPEWKDIVYPKRLSQSEFLKYYSEFFYTSEINSTFYQIPAQRTVESWARNSPPNFKFSAKIPDLITHKANLDLDTGIGPLSTFLKNMIPLMKENKVLAFLLQLPPKFGKKEELDFKKMEIFANYWSNTVREQLISEEINPPELVVEFRNKYWMQDKTFELLRQHNLVYCAVVEPLLPPRLDITSESMFYIRFHGYGKKPRPWFDYYFTDKQLNEWTKKLLPIINSIRDVKGKEKRVVLYFNNHFSGNAVKNALELAKKMNLPHKKGLDDITKPLDELTGLGKNQKRIDEFF
ncbi:MAG: DUF72 domain-containing protein [archaeon]|nr:DUF72 domain-containing protein [archaeon]